MSKTKREKKDKSLKVKYPTVGHTYKVDAASDLIFRQWLLEEKWLPRPEKPDFFIDFSVEVVRNGEPTSDIFRAQLKGRSLSRREKNERRERFETKHLLYYLGCDQPVFLFLIDHATREGYWVFAQKYIRDRWTEAHLMAQGTVDVDFNPADNLQGLRRFDAALREALVYVREQSPGTPSAAIHAVKAEYEQLDSRFEVKVTADERQTSIEVSPRDPSTVITFKLSPKVEDRALRDLLERGTPLQIPATEISAPDSPILESVLKKAGSKEVTICTGATFAGAIQLLVANHTLHIDGQWLLAPKRLQFEGNLKDSPLKAFLQLDADEFGKFVKPMLYFSVDLSRWNRQPLRTLAYFDGLVSFFSEKSLRMRCVIKGNTFLEGASESLNFENDSRVIGPLRWIGHCRNVAAKFGINPRFTSDNDYAALDTDDVVLLVQLVFGGYEQNYEGETAEIVADWPHPTLPPKSEPLSLTVENQFRDFDFLGAKLKIGPLTYRVSDLEVTKIQKMDGNLYKLTGTGTALSRLRIDLACFEKSYML